MQVASILIDQFRSSKFLGRVWDIFCPNPAELESSFLDAGGDH